MRQEGTGVLCTGLLVQYSAQPLPLQLVLQKARACVLVFCVEALQEVFSSRAPTTTSSPAPFPMCSQAVVLNAELRA